MSDEVIKARISEIENRNARVELEKAWELSLTRKFSILLLTFLSTALLFLCLEAPWYNAIIPTLGFYLSTLSLPIIKKWWTKMQ